MNQAVEDFISAIPDDTMQADSRKLVQIMQEETGEAAYLHGSSIVGFGNYHYKYASGWEGDTVVVGFSPRKQALVLYGISFYDQNTGQLDKLGKYKAGKGCLYIKQLSDIDEAALSSMIREAYVSKTGN